MPELLYKPVVPDFSEVGSDVQQIGQQVLRYKQQKERYKQERRDMLMKHYMAEAQVQPYDAIRSKNQEMISGYVEQARQELKPLAEKIDGEGNDWKYVNEARQIQSKYQQKINQVKQWEKTYLEDRKIIEKNPEEYAYDSIQSTLQYQGGPYQSRLRKKIGDFGKMLMEESKEMYSGDVATVSNIYDTEGKFIKSSSEFVNEFYKPDGQGGVVRDEERQKRFFKNRLAGNRKLQLAGLKEMKERGRLTEDGKIYMPSTNKTYAVGDLAEYAYDQYKERQFPIKTEKVVKEAEDDTGWKNGNFYVNGKKRLLLTGGNRKVIETEAFKNQAIDYWGATDQNIDVDQHIRGARVVGKDGMEKEDVDARTYKGARLVGLAKTEDGWYAHLKAKQGEKVLKKGGKKLYRDPRYGVMGTKKDIINGYIDNGIEDNKSDASKLFEQGLAAGSIELQYKGRQDIDVYAPVDKNPELKSLYTLQDEIKEKPKEAAQGGGLSGQGQSGINWSE